MPTVCITGANRGIGLAFAKQYAREGWRVLGCCRNPGGASLPRNTDGEIELFALDVMDPSSLSSLRDRLSGERIDILINNAGIYGPRSLAFGETDYEAWSEVFAVNAMSPLRVSEVLFPLIEKGKQKIIVNITSKMGSISDNRGGGSYLYRSSKAALNAVTKSMAVDLQPKGFICAVIHPGWVRTDMGGPNGLIDTEESVSGMRRVIARLKPEQSGGFFNYDGSEIPW